VESFNACMSLAVRQQEEILNLVGQSQEKSGNNENKSLWQRCIFFLFIFFSKNKQNLQFLPQPNYLINKQRQRE